MKPHSLFLGTVQDGGAPHIGCKKECCTALFNHPDLRMQVVSLGIIDPENNQSYIFESTPDFPIQAKQFLSYCDTSHAEMPDGVFLTHAHIGHYTGLIYLGKEAANTDQVPVYAMPKMKTFLAQNGPWSPLVTNQNIQLRPIFNGKTITLTPNLKVIPLQVPHRDEFSETVGYIIQGPHKKVLFIPDIDKWDKWHGDIKKKIDKVDYAFLDGTFYDGVEINNRDITTIPHPFIIETMELFKNLSASEKAKIHFIHFNHTNKLLIPESEESKQVVANGFQLARKGQIITL